MPPGDPSGEGLRCGVVWFHDPHRHAAGWAARADGEPFLIAGPQDLPSDTVWITNLDYRLIHDAGMAPHANFRESGYLRTRLELLTGQMGIPAEETPARVQAAAQVFERVRGLARRFLTLGYLPQGTLKRGIREGLADTDPLLSEAIVQACDAATEPATFVERSLPSSAGGEGRRVAFRLPRLPHARAILGTTLPTFTAAWRPVTTFPHTPEALKGWVAGFEGPLLARVVVQRADRRHGHLINHGSSPGGGRTGRSGRNWVTGFELLTLLELAQVEVRELWVSDDNATLETLTARLFSPAGTHLAPLHELSVSAGLFLENLWIGAASRLEPPPPLAPRAPPHNPWAPFLRAHDRALCLMAAIRLFEAGLDVLSYGVGTVWVRSDPSQRDAELAAIARRLGLIPSALAVKPEEDRPEALNDPLALMQTLHIQGRYRDPLPLRHADPGTPPDDFGHLLYPALAAQILPRAAEEQDARVVRVGDRLHAPLLLTLPPQHPEPFNVLFRRLLGKRIPYRVALLLGGDGLGGLALREALASVLYFTSGVNRQFKAALEALRERRLEGESIVRLQVLFDTWVSLGEKGGAEGAEQLRRRRSAELASAVQGWGSCEVSPVIGDPMLGVVSALPAARDGSPAPAAASPLRDAVTLWPFTRPASPWEAGSVVWRTPDGKLFPYTLHSSHQASWIDLGVAGMGSGKSVRPAATRSCGSASRA